MHALRRFAFKAGLNTLYVGGAHRLFGNRTAGAGAILMFHHVRRPRPMRFRPNAHLEITPDFLAAVVDRIRELDIDIVDMDEACRRIQSPAGGRRFVVLTFDDGYRNNLSLAYPVLKARAAPFTVYVATGLIDRIAAPWWDVVGAIVERRERVRVEIAGAMFDRPTRSTAQKYRACEQLIEALISVDEREQRRIVERAASEHGVDLPTMLDDAMMDWNEVQRLAEDPLATIGAHTVHHYALARLDAGQARSEIADSRKRIAEMTGQRPRHFAYPYGSPATAFEREFAIAEELGFTSAVTTRRGVLLGEGANRMAALPRISVNGDYQSIRYLDVLLSGVPYALEARINRLRGDAGPLAMLASASTL